MGDRGRAGVEIPVRGKQGKMPVCEFLFFVPLSINFSVSLSITEFLTRLSCEFE